MAIEEGLKVLVEAQATNEMARAELGKILAELPISDYGQLEYYAEDWGVEIHWHAPANIVFSAYTLSPHQFCDDECDRFCEEAWNREPLQAETLIRAINLLLQERVGDLQAETEQIRKAIHSFSRKEVGFSELKAIANI